MTERPSSSCEGFNEVVRTSLASGGIDELTETGESLDMSGFRLADIVHDLRTDRMPFRSRSACSTGIPSLRAMLSTPIP